MIKPLIKLDISYVIFHYQCCFAAFILFSSPGSAYTEPFPMNPVSAGLSADEDHGRTSEEEEGAVEQGYERQVSGGGMRKRVKAREKVVYLAP